MVFIDTGIVNSLPQNLSKAHAGLQEETNLNVHHLVILIRLDGLSVTAQLLIADTACVPCELQQGIRQPWPAADTSAQHCGTPW
mmetsp:Transcript_36382/g.71921  ORF Transcript_36382/g.71921 Transcript_36382/m.71921 type:complete len:84 (-) Transcript_36382:631-882(-)